MAKQEPPPPAPRSAAEWAPIDSLVPWPDNPRRDQPIEEVAESIRVFGFGRPIVARLANREIIAGHTSWRAARLAGLVEVPVRFLDVDEETAHQLAIADNALGEHASWEEERRKELLERAPLHRIRAMGVDARALILRRKAERRVADRSRLRFQVVVDVGDEAAQATLLDRLEQEGYKCRALIL